MNILFISENFPYPLDSGGRIRTFHIMKGLSRQHKLTLVTTIEHEDTRKYLPELAKICQDIKVITTSQETSFALGKKVLNSLFSSTPIVVKRHYLPQVAAEIQRLLASDSFDVVHFDHLDASFYRSLIPASVKTVLDEHNIVTNQVKTSIAAEPNILKKFYMRTQLGKTLRYESRVCPQMTRCFVCSDRDKTYLHEMAPQAQIRTIPNGVDVEYFGDRSWFDPVEHAQEPHAIIFVGMLDYGPGGVGVRYFCQDILPLLQQEIPDIRFYAVGQNPPAYLQTLASHNPNIVLTGRVPDIRPYAAKAKVFVVPLKSGSGTRLKILDAMAMGIPVVSTSIGAEGLEVRSGEQLFLADTPETFASAILKLLKDDELAAAIRRNATNFVRETYSWEKIWGDLLAAYQELE